MNITIQEYHHGAELVKSNLNGLWLCRVLKGSIRVLFEQKSYKLATGTVFAVQEGATFRVQSSTQNMVVEVMNFDESLMNVVYALLGAEADIWTLGTAFWSDTTLGEPFGRMFATDYELLRMAVGQPDLIAHHKMVTANLVHLLLSIFNAVGDTTTSSSGDNSKRSRQLLNHFFELVGENILSGQRTITFYADKLCVSERYLFKVCKKETGKTPKELINEFLIGQIKNALLTTEMTHQQIADQFNFPDQSAFGQFFKRMEGTSPSEWRQKYR
ncbi:MAG: helix-turn-helix domain-containing protein [Bacteroidales bacterium]|nr:helix-turn-helix domain-containing protein [Bacteroidales bacterium]